MRVGRENTKANAGNQKDPFVFSASWQGYLQPYVQNIISGATKALQLLSVLTFDPKLLFWTQGLKNHLENRIREAEREAEEAKRYIF